MGSIGAVGYHHRVMRWNRPAPAWVLLLTLACAHHEKPSVLASGPSWLTAERADPVLDHKHVVFVAGFLNELIPGYFTDNVAVTRDLGGTTSTLFPSSGHSLAQDVEQISREIDACAGKGVVLFGHSKGGAAVLLTVLQHPDLLFSGKVDAVIVVQGAVGGSPLADVLSSVARKNQGLRSLRTDQAERVFVEAVDAAVINLSDAELERLFSRIFYLRSAHQTGGKVAAELAATELALRGHGANDGLVPSQKMKLDWGVDLGVLDADHASLTVSSFLSTSTSEERKAVTRALYREVGRTLGWSTSR